MAMLIGRGKGPVIGPGYYSGYRQQRGGAFWSKALSAIVPALRFLGKKAAGAAADVLSDVSEGQNVKEAIQTRVQETGKKLASSAAQRALKFAQTGKGRKRSVKKMQGGSKRVTTNKIGKARKPNTLLGGRRKTQIGGKKKQIGVRKKQIGGKRKTNKSKRMIPNFLL